MNSLKKDISNKASRLRLLASANHFVSYLLALVAAFASIAASVGAAMGDWQQPWLSLIAGIPAAALILQNTIKFQERSIWQFNKEFRLRDLLYQIDEGEEPSEIRERYLRINRETLVDFPGFALAHLSADKEANR
jgi:hypothetical protein